jgi:hypothetical protein
MGIFSGIGKAFKSVFKGIMKVFAPILKPLGKLMNSSLGKAIMIGLSIFTLGTAMVAGYGAFAATSAAQAAGTASGGFVAAFVEGGKAFLSTLVGKGAEEGAKTAAAGAEGAVQGIETAGIIEGGAGAAIEGATQATASTGGALAEGAAGSGAFGPGATGDVMSRAVTSGAEGASGAGAMLPEMAGDAAKVADLTAKTGATIPEVELGWLGKAKEAAGKFADYSTSEGGGQVVGSLISAAGNYYTEKDRQEFEDRIRRQWGKGEDDAGIRNIHAGGQRAANLKAPTGVPAAGRATAREGGSTRPYFDRAYGAGAPAPAGG